MTDRCENNRHTSPHVFGQRHVVGTHTGVTRRVSSNLWSCQAHELTATIGHLAPVSACRLFEVMVQNDVFWR